MSVFGEKPPMWRQYRRFLPGEQILVACDTAPGNGDNCGAQFLSKTNKDVPLVYQSADGTINMTNRLVSVLEQIYDQTGVPPIVTYEGNNGGEYELKRLSAMNRLGKFIIYQWPVWSTDSKGNRKITSFRDTWVTTEPSRKQMLMDLQDQIDNLVFGIYDQWTIEELHSFVVINGKPQATSKSHDDLVMALAIAVQLYLYADIKVEETAPANASVQKALAELPPLGIDY